MKRSEGRTIQITPLDWTMAKAGIKTACSRYGVEHATDFYNVYHKNLGREVNEDTELTIFYFETV